MSITGPGHVPRPPFARRGMHPEAGRRIHLADGAAVFLVGDGDVGRQEVDSAHIQPDGADGPHRHLDVVGMHDVGDVDRGPAGADRLPVERR